MGTLTPAKESILSRSEAETGTVVEGRTRRGRPCRLIDRTETLSRATLEDLLAELIDQDQFGALGLSEGDVLSLDAPRFTHIQLEGRLYRFFLYRYHAVIDTF